MEFQRIKLRTLPLNKQKKIKLKKDSEHYWKTHLYQDTIPLGSVESVVTLKLITKEKVP